MNLHPYFFRHSVYQIQSLESMCYFHCWKLLKRWEHQITWPVSWEIYAGQEATIRIGHGRTHWFQTGKGCILSPCLFNLYAEHILRKARLDEAQAGINTARRNISNLIYADDITLMAESEEELKNLLIKVKEESEKVGLKLNIQKLRSWHLFPSFHGK